MFYMVIINGSHTILLRQHYRLGYYRLVLGLMYGLGYWLGLGLQYGLGFWLEYGLAYVFIIQYYRCSFVYY